MSPNKSKSLNTKTALPPSKGDGANKRAALKPPSAIGKKAARSLENPERKIETSESVKEMDSAAIETATSEKANADKQEIKQLSLSYAEQQKQNSRQRAQEKDKSLLNRDRWLARNGHTLTFAGIFLFTLILYFRPYEWIPGLSGFESMALVTAVGTLLIYLPSQFVAESSLTAFPVEVKCVLFMAAWALLTIPIAVDQKMAWGEFSNNFIKVVIIFVMMVNTLRTKSRLMALMWLPIALGVMLSYQALRLYQKGELKVEGYRVGVDFGGMFGNPNELAVHLVVFIPIVVALGIASKYKSAKLVYFSAAALMLGGVLVTQSRGAFLGLMATAAVLVWKFGKKQRLKTILISSVVGLAVTTFAPGTYGLRVLSIFVPSLDPVGSSTQRTELLKQSVLVSLRNPFGIGIGTFPVVGLRNLETHNSYTQVSAELGLLALAAYLIFMVSPFRKLGAIERRMFARADFSWIYYLSIGIQGGIVAYMVSSFFGPLAYSWHVYYLIAFAICLRRIYRVEESESETAAESDSIGYAQPPKL